MNSPNNTISIEVQEYLKSFEFDKIKKSLTNIKTLVDDEINTKNKIIIKLMDLDFKNFNQIKEYEENLYY